MQKIYIFFIIQITGCNTANLKSRKCNDSAVIIAVAKGQIPQGCWL